jgi:hypothetical protein
MEELLFGIWAHLFVKIHDFDEKTGLSAPIPQPLWGLWDFRFYPLRVLSDDLHIPN